MGDVTRRHAAREALCPRARVRPPVSGRRARRVARAVALGILLAPFAAPSPQDRDDAPTRDATATVWCLDEARSIVRRVARWRCDGREVDEREARRVQQQRVERIKRVLERERNPLLPGRRLGGTGTGFFISADGHVLTNNHVVDDCKAVTVTPAGGTEGVAEIRAADAGRDLALLETRSTTRNAAVFRSFDEQIENEPVTVVGYPLHGKVVIKPVLVTGHVKPDANPRNPNVFAMAIDIRRGNSGGPVLDEAGRVIGVVFAKVDTPSMYENTGKLVRDVGFAIRLPVVRDFLRGQPVAVKAGGDAQPLEQAARLARAREFVAQIGCWR